MLFVMPHTAFAFPEVAVVVWQLFKQSVSFLLYFHSIPTMQAYLTKILTATVALLIPLLGTANVKHFQILHMQ